MRAIIVEDEAIMLKRFVRLCEGIADLNITGQFDNAAEALCYARKNPVELAFLDVKMPGMNGVELAKQLRALRPDILIVFVSAYDEYLRDFNQIGGDYYIIKPYTKETIDMMMDRIRLIASRQQKPLYIHTFGRFNVLRDGKPVPLTGKAKEILALVVTKRGKEISNEEIFSTIWEERQYSNANMVVYYNALRRLKQALEREGLSELLISTPHGQMINTALFDCDYYAWQDKNMGSRDKFEGEFLSEYSWGEYLLADIYNEYYNS
ncbi:MAG: response regulator [Acutalibacteraceae bacterium]|jgi:two-component system LytT family response regulator